MNHPTVYEFARANDRLRQLARMVAIAIDDDPNLHGNHFAALDEFDGMVDEAVSWLQPNPAQEVLA